MKPWILLIAGPTRSGKTTLAGRLNERLGGTRISLGDMVRHRTAALGLPADRRTWQQVGQDWVTSNATDFCDAIARLIANDPHVVIDGLRHTQMYRLLADRYQDRQVLLVFIDTVTTIRRQRLADEGHDQETIDRIATHPAENDGDELCEIADVIIHGDKNFDRALNAIELRLATPH